MKELKQFALYYLQLHKYFLIINRFFECSFKHLDNLHLNFNSINAPIKL